MSLWHTTCSSLFLRSEICYLLAKRWQAPNQVWIIGYVHPPTNEWQRPDLYQHPSLLLSYSTQPHLSMITTHSSLLSIYLRVHIVNSYDHFHVYTVRYTMDLGLVCHVNRCRESVSHCAFLKFKWYVRVVCVNGEWSVNCVRRHPVTVCLWGRSNPITAGSRWYATEPFVCTSV